MHRVHRLDRGTAWRLFGPDAVAAGAEDGIVDVHRYLVLTAADGEILIDCDSPPEALGRVPVAAVGMW